jgi:hypothetical protein
VLSKRKVQAPAETSAAELFQQFVEQPAVSLPEGAARECNDPAVLDAQMRLYRFASVLLAILDAEHQDHRFSAVREGLERRFFPPTYDHGDALLQQLRSAMSELAKLIQPQQEPKPLSWALRWFERAGAHETSPALLDLFALQWLDHFVAVAGALREFNPVT